ncbi:MAG: magnesium-translocating P-type ATPase [Lachnospiraceae bacterium]|jgi:Mg2+-importing ATPase|nr:magnesium-translocating P-type ATPase [Lachnospiraceae bacterium]
MAIHQAIFHSIEQFLLPVRGKQAKHDPTKKDNVESRMREYSECTIEEALSRQGTQTWGLLAQEAASRLERFGENAITSGNLHPTWRRLREAVVNSFNIILIIIAVVTYFTDVFSASAPDWLTILIILALILISSLVAFIQGQRSDAAAAKLSGMISNQADVWRDGKEVSIPMKDVVPGDIIRLSAGDMLPADVRFLTTKDTFIAQSALTGESNPVEKFADPQPAQVGPGAQDPSRSCPPLAADTASGGPASPQGPPAGPACGASATAPVVTSHKTAAAHLVDLTDLQNIGFMGTNVISGSATALALFTGNDTYIGSMAKSLSGNRAKTSFERGVGSISSLLVRMMLAMVPIVFLVNGIAKQDFLGALLFAISIAVGLTPEMLPVIMTSTLAKGAVAMSRRKVIVKTLGAIQTFGEMDILCTDKTGTLTRDKIELERYLDLHGNDDKDVLRYAYLNSHFQTGLKNLIDLAVINRAVENGLEPVLSEYTRIDEIPFDFARRRMSVVLTDSPAGAIPGDPPGADAASDTGISPYTATDGLQATAPPATAQATYTVSGADAACARSAPPTTAPRRFLVTKGAVEEMLSISSYALLGGEKRPLDDAARAEAMATYEKHNDDGLRMIAVAVKDEAPEVGRFGVSDENGMTLIGFVGFLDPPKESAAAAIETLKGHGVRTVVLTGDSEGVARKVCAKVGVKCDAILTGRDVESMDDATLTGAIRGCDLFAKLSPAQKERVVKAFQEDGHTVGYMGDGINDAPSLRQADVGISVDSAVDIAKETADIILLEKDLTVLCDGVVEGRHTFGNIIKYIKMAASGNFGNMISVLVASIFLPFLPMLPVQILTQNLLCDFSQMGIPFDRVDAGYLDRPHRWDTRSIRTFMFVMGPVSSIFDVFCYLVMWFALGARTPELSPLFQCGWFVFGTLSQICVIYMIRTRGIPFLQSTPALPLFASTALVAVGVLVIGFSPFAVALDMQSVPMAFVPWLALLVIGYMACVQLIKRFYVKAVGEWM